MEELMNDDSVDLLAMCYAFHLGSHFNRAMLGMQFPDIEKAFRDREYKVLSKQGNKERHAKRDKAKALVLQEWQKDVSRFPSAEKAGSHFADWLEAQGYSYEPRTVVTWIREHAKAKGIKLR
jgi:hypothetical protein